MNHRIFLYNRYRKNYYIRQIDKYFSPVEIDITANIIKPQLYFNKFDKTFICCANEVIQSKTKQIEYVQI